MENQTRYDLNSEIEHWKQALKTQGNLTIEDALELDTHLRETISEFQRRGLNDEESFWLACKRMGQLNVINHEYFKADPIAVWRERLFWMTVSSVASYLLLTWKDLLGTWLTPESYNLNKSFYLGLFLIVITLVIMIRKGRMPNPFRFGNAAQGKIVFGFGLALAATVFAGYLRSLFISAGGEGLAALITNGYNMGMIFSWYGNAVWPAAMILILLFTAKRKVPLRV